MTQPTVHTDITFTKPSPWTWYVSLGGKRVGTVNRDNEFGFTARDMDYHTISRGYASAEAAMKAWVPSTDSHL
jgi:hypothetical protein